MLAPMESFRLREKNTVGGIRGLLQALSELRVQEARDDKLVPVPILHPPATTGEISILEWRAGFALPSDYLELLAASDGVENIEFWLSILGCRDWPAGRALQSAFSVRAIEFSVGNLEEFGIADDPEALFPIGGHAEFGKAIFAVDPGRKTIPGSILLFADADILCFALLSDLLLYQLDPVSCIQAGRVISLSDS